MDKRLSELSAELRDSQGGHVLVFDCPCDRCKDIRDNPDAERNALWCDARICIPLLPMERGWSVISGSTIDDLTIRPSILIGDPNKNKLGGCEGWHGYLTNGVLVPC